jgi:quercetin dioxygenase-like cupin family protein
MSKKWMAVFGAALVAAIVIVGGVLPSGAQTPPTITAEILTGRAVFPDDIDLQVKRKLAHSNTEVVRTGDPSRTVTARFAVDPGAQFPWHTHSGPVIVNVVSGTLVYVMDNCSTHAYPAGTAFMDLGHGDVHSAYSPSNGNGTVLVATFLEAPPEPDPLLIPADAPPGCVLNP